MLKRSISFFLIAVFVLSSSGCSGVLRKKFVRKKDLEKKTTPVFKPYDYKSEFTPRQLYANHYAFWRNAVTEVIKIVGEDEINNKKLKIYAYYSYDEIGQMHNLLPEEQKAKLEPYIEDFKKIVSKLQDDNYVAGHRHVLNKTLKHYYNEVSKNFSYIKMKNYLQG